MKIYVAGAWVEKKERAEKWIAKLREAGFEITHDWTKDDTPSTTTTDAQLPPGERKKRAEEDFKGVLTADLLWLLAPNERGASGAWTEFGIALGLRGTGRKLKIVVSGRSWQRTIFTALMDNGFENDEQAFNAIMLEKSVRESRSP